MSVDGQSVNKVPRGAARTLTFTPTAAISGLASRAASFTVRRGTQPPTGPVLLHLTSADGDVALSSSAVTVALTGAMTLALDAGVYSWHLWLTDEPADVIASGSLSIVPPANPNPS